MVFCLGSLLVLFCVQKNKIRDGWIRDSENRRFQIRIIIKRDEGD